MLLTLKQVKDSRIVEIAGVCADSDDFVSLVNEGTQLLLNRGDFTGTLVPIYVCAQRGCVTFPRYVRNVRQLNLCHRPISVNNIWFQFVEQPFYRSWCGENGIAFNPGREWGIGNMNAQGYYCTFNDVQGNCYIRAYPMVQADIGKTVTIFGEDENGMPLRTNNGDGTWSDGLVISIAAPYGSTSTLVRRINRVVKDETQGDIRLYAYNADQNLLYDLAVYQPSETNPNYARYQLQAASNKQPCGILALVKLAFIPVKNDNDLVLIGNLRALKFAIQSVRASEAKDEANATELEMKAVHELNLELRNDNPDSQIPINLKSFGTAHPSRHGIGRIF